MIAQRRRSGDGGAVPCTGWFAIWIGGRMKSWSMADIKENADMAETWPGSGVLNWGEIGWGALSAWVTLSVAIGGDATLPEYDVESVKSMFEEWWRSANVPHEGPSGASREGPLDAVVGPHMEE